MNNRENIKTRGSGDHRNQETIWETRVNNYKHGPKKGLIQIIQVVDEHGETICHVMNEEVEGLKVDPEAGFPVGKLIETAKLIAGVKDMFEFISQLAETNEEAAEIISRLRLRKN